MLSVRAWWGGVGDAPARGRVVVKEGPTEPPVVDGPKRGVGVWFVEEPAKQPGLRAVGLGPPMAAAVEPEPVVRGADLGTAGAASASRRAMVDLGDGLAAADAPAGPYAGHGGHKQLPAAQGTGFGLAH